MYPRTDCCAVFAAGPYVFQQFETLQGAGLQPAAAEALKLLHRLASDPGIVAIMRSHRWTVGKLSEMPPEVRYNLQLQPLHVARTCKPLRAPQSLHSLLGFCTRYDMSGRCSDV